MPRTIACVLAAVLTLVASAQPAHAALGKLLSGKAEIIDGRHELTPGHRVQTGNLPSGR